MSLKERLGKIASRRKEDLERSIKQKEIQKIQQDKASLERDLLIKVELKNLKEEGFPNLINKLEAINSSPLLARSNGKITEGVNEGWESPALSLTWGNNSIEFHFHLTSPIITLRGKSSETYKYTKYNSKTDREIDDHLIEIMEKELYKPRPISDDDEPYGWIG